MLRKFAPLSLVHRLPQRNLSLWSRYMGKDAAVAEDNWGGDGSLRRWSMIAPAFFTHLCIGSPYAWSAVSGTLSQEIGFVVPAADDWTFAEVAVPLSIVFALQGIAAAAGGKWQMRVGERTSLCVAASFFGGGLMVGAAGIAMHNLPLLYLGYGLLAGTGVGLGYTPPVQMLLQWFPDRRGLASGMTIAGFGSGALLFAPVMQKLSSYFAVMPRFVGPAGSRDIFNEGGRLFIEENGTPVEVVIANAADIAKLPYDLAEGIYIVGSGSTGSASALAICGLGYLSIMLGSAFWIKRPSPKTVLPPAPASSSCSDGNVNADTLLRTPQFALLSTSFFCISCGGMGLFSVAKPMMSEVFSGTLPGVVTASFASAYVMMLSGANLSGRLGWSAFSDLFGRRSTFHIFTIGSIPLYLSIPYFVSQVIETQSELPLYAFVGASFLAITCMGGTYALLPAYEADLFGSKYIGAIHGRFLLASTAAALIGPSILLTLRKMSEQNAIRDLVSKIDPVLFEKTFGAPVSMVDQLVQAKTLSIVKLMEIAPPGIMDPSPFVYNSTMYTMAALMSVAAVSHAMVRPVNAKYFESNVSK